MKFSIAIASLLSLAAGLPTAPNSQTGSKTATVLIRTIGLGSQHYSAPSEQESTIIEGHTISVLVGQVLSLNRDGLRNLQALQIVRVTPGSDLTNTLHEIEQDDTKVWCKASLDYASAGPEFTIEAGQVSLKGGMLADVTQLACAYGQENLLSIRKDNVEVL